MYWNATLNICNTAARWDLCGGKYYEYYNWMCAYYEAYNYADFLYQYDGNYSSGLSNCIGSFMSDIPNFKYGTDYC